MKSILIVEDDQVVATAYRKRFKDAGWEVEWAPDGVEGIKAVGTMKPDVVLLDLLMPRLDGIEVLKFIRANPDLKHLPVVVFSNSYMTNLIESAWRAGADQCLMKASTTPQILFDSIAKAMQKAASRRTPTVVPTPAPAPTASPSQRPGPMLVAAAPSPVMIVEPKRAEPSVARPSFAPLVQPLSSPTPRAFAAPPVPAPPPPSPQASPAHVAGGTTRSSGSTTAFVKQGSNAIPTAPVVEAASAAGSPLAPASTQPAVDPEFQAQIRQIFVAGAAAKIESARAMALSLAQPAHGAIPEQFGELFRKIHSLTGNAAVAGCPAIANYANTFEAYLQELQEKPRFINVSTLRTIRQAIDFIALLFQYALAEEPPELARRILVIDSDPMSGQAIALTLEKAGLRTHLAGDPIEAMALGSTENFDLVVVAAEMPDMSGFELCTQLQTLPGCASVPVLFVSSLEQFASHAELPALARNDLIARPFLVIELTLKAMTLLETRRIQGHFRSVAA